MTVSARTIKRRGMAAVLAMLYLTLMASLALGFYASTNTATIVSQNELRSARALSASESGMEFIRWHLYNIQIAPKTPPSQLLTKVATQLSTRINGTKNMANRTVAFSPEAGQIDIPAGPAEYIMIDNDGWRFHATLTQVDGDIVATIKSTDGAVTARRALRLNFAQEPDRSVFRYGVAAKGKIKLGGDTDLEGDEQAIDGSIFSTSIDEFKHPIEIKKKASISGDVFMSDPDGNLKIGKKVEIHGTSDPQEYEQYIHRGEPAPEFPVIDTTEFKPFATSTYTGAKHDDDGVDYYQNVVIPPNVNPHFDRDTVIEGVLYIKMPNQITFAKDTTVRGVIVVEPSANPRDYKDKKNTISFEKGATLYDISTLPVNSQFPQELHDLSGATIIAPDTQLKFKGKSGSWTSSIIAEDITLHNHSSGLVSGSLISYGDVKFDKKGDLIIDRNRNRMPMIARRSLPSHFVPVSSSYSEVAP
jgi:hypothetical protein